MRCEELNAYLDGLKLDKYVWISEDASGIINKIEFDPNTNQMVGLVLPMTRNTGMPIAYTYLARSSEEIEKNMKKKNVFVSIHCYGTTVEKRCASFYTPAIRHRQHIYDTKCTFEMETHDKRT